MSRPAKFVYFADIAVGVMIVGLCGACTLYAMTGEMRKLGFLPLIVGGAPIAFGLWLIVHALVGLIAGNARGE